MGIHIQLTSSGRERADAGVGFGGGRTAGVGVSSGEREGTDAGVCFLRKRKLEMGCLSDMTPVWTAATGEGPPDAAGGGAGAGAGDGTTAGEVVGGGMEVVENVPEVRDVRACRGTLPTYAHPPRHVSFSIGLWAKLTIDGLT